MTSPRPRLTVRPTSESDWARVVEVDGHAFGTTMEPDELADARRMHEPWRGLGAYDGDTLAGTAAAYAVQLPVPGAVVPAAGVTWVGVLPVYRRRGVLRSLMTRQLAELHADGREPVAVLWASEPPIYGRFGYGMASRALSVTVPRRADALRADRPQDPSLRLRLVPPEDWRTAAGVYDAVAGERPGMLLRDERWHTHASADPPSRRQGRSALRCVVVEDGAGVRGYARYSTKPDWSPGRPEGTVHVRELVALDAPARAALYRYLFDLDLMLRTELWNVPVDDPLLHWLTDPRAARPTLQDALYLRLVDVPVALAARRYAAAVDVVLDVADPVCPGNAGRWRLVGGPDGARCWSVDSPADLSLAVADLGSAYLGGVALGELGQAGRVVEHREGALAAATAAFAWAVQPWCPMVF
jgi:predicted acetyltransferase